MGYESEEKKAARDPNSNQARLDQIWLQQEHLEYISIDDMEGKSQTALVLENIVRRQEHLESDRALDQLGQKRGEEIKNQAQKLEKMGIMFFSIMLLLCVIGDLIDILTVGTIGWLVGLFIDGIVLLATGLSKAGRKQFKRIFLGVLGETIPIPFLAIVPFRSLFLIWSFIKSRSVTVQSISSVAPKVI